MTTLVKSGLLASGLAVAALMAGGTAALASTIIDFDGARTDPYIEDGFSFDPIRIVNGNCLDGGCLALNDNETTTQTLVGGGSFDLESINFNLLGQGNDNTLTITGSNAASISFSTTTLENNEYNFFDFAGLFDNVTSILFATGGGGNVRIDDLRAAAAPTTVIPLPAALPLLLVAIGGLAFIGRRRKA